MSNFWWGVLALPLLLLAVAVAVGIVLGAWVLAEHWAQGRTAEMNYDAPREGIYQRHAPVTWIVAAPKLRRFRLGFGCGLLYYRGLNRVPIKTFREIRWRVPSALEDIDEAMRSGDPTAR